MQMLPSEWGREWEEWAGWFFEGFVVGFCVWLGVWHCTWLCAWLCTWNGGSGSGVVHCWLAFPVEEVCCYLERGGGAGMVLFVVGVSVGKEGEGCVIDVSTWNGGSGSGVVHCWLAFPVEEVCCYLERGGGAGRVLFVVGVPGGSGMGTPGTEGVNWEGSVQGRRARWKGRRGLCD